MGLTGISEQVQHDAAENGGSAPPSDLLLARVPTHGRKEASEASLEIVAAIYRGARSIWPLAEVRVVRIQQVEVEAARRWRSPSDGKVGGGEDLGKDLMKLVGLAAPRSSTATVVTEAP